MIGARVTCGVGRLLLALRYRVRVSGLHEVTQRGAGGLLLLPNHPALIDPIILLAHLYPELRPRSLADRDQINRFGIRWLARLFRVRPILDMARYGDEARRQIQQVLAECADGLRRGENVLLYPSGHLYRSRLEDLRGNSSVDSLLQAVPEARVVLVRTRGLWGSAFSMVTGEMPRVARVVRRAVFSLLANFVFFTPRREVRIELLEPADLPADRARRNAAMEQFYNADAPPAAYVPYTIWERGGRRELPDPSAAGVASSAQVPASTREIVSAYLRQQTGADALRDEDDLARDLGLDSLARADLLLWLSKEFGSPVADVTALRTVGDVLLAARGEAMLGRPAELRPIARRWFRRRTPRRATVPSGQTIPEVFLRQAQVAAGRAIAADQLSGVRTYRDLVTGILLLRPFIAELPGERVGVMLPASVGAAVVYLAVLFARREPVMVNWTTGTRNILHSLELTGVRQVLTAGPLVARIESLGTDLSPIRHCLMPLEELRRGIPRARVLGAVGRGWLNWGALREHDGRTPSASRAAGDAGGGSRNAAILLTSGSEALPKAVPLTHANLLANVRDVLETFTVFESDRLLAFLPPFHSFGLTVTMLVPLLSGMRVVFHANPTESATLARLIRAYQPTVLAGTPTFLAGILRAARRDELASVRLAVTGAEKCPPRTYEMFAEHCPQARLLEGYGVTECSPIISANREEDARPGTIGRPLPSVERAILDPETGRPASTGAPGMLLVRGPSVFSGYLGDEVASPFVEHDGKHWYRTGDLVSEDADGIMTFRGRLKRFVKLGGEMISLPAIESVLEQHYAGEADEGPVVAVEATSGEEQPEITLFTTRDLDRATVNRHIRESRLSPLHNVSRVVRVDSIPVLGTGKTDYRALRERLEAVRE
jgi:acyl-CoA synthetase (AMP-forming)/AMP-acid ligase II/1-acyl-sn-glycerol-3-phosphate acyltransferase/acyl carrier protein